LTSLPVVGENPAGQTNVNVLLLVKAEVLPTEGSIPPEYAAPSSILDTPVESRWS
jgi:hypothetical protein